MIMNFLMIILMMVFILQAIAFITLYERHLLGSSQNRLGPTKVSFMGVLQALLGCCKVVKKEQMTPLNSSDLSFLLVPGIAFVVMYLEWYILPYFFDFLSFEYSMLFFLCLIGFSVYTTLISGIVSKSKYGIVGALRASSQSVSYEIAFSLYLLAIMIHYSMFSFVSEFNLSLLIIYLPFLVMIIAELNRAPLELAEGVSELVSGYNVEYASVAFVLLFLSEYGSLIFFSVMSSMLFFKFSMIVSFVVFSIIVFIRSSYPRFRYDKMMTMFWFKFLPISLIFLFYFFVLFV
uniref:NADH-ubiquinone oxidoreductase chain 1 n=1 Tax=Cylicocyclus ashworthi TaxID=53996 RepID=A0A6G6D7I2_9BILA|nr:NADH dehydrogenase subunit 1 [Cylicocyclus ashworthi]QIE12496.1 NADH dehydrogenase subunit 1 [Cylicocyclus ashworthi]